MQPLFGAKPYKDHISTAQRPFSEVHIAPASPAQPPRPYHVPLTGRASALHRGPAAMQASQLHAGVCGRPLPARARVQAQRRHTLRLCVEARKQLTVKESRIGKAPITVPAGVTFEVDGQTVTVKVRTGCARGMLAFGRTAVCMLRTREGSAPQLGSCRRAKGTR